MSTYLGKRTMTGFKDTQNPVIAGGWTVKFSPDVLAVKVVAEVYHIAVKGPAPSTFQIYIDTTFYSNVARGDINDYDPSKPLPFSPGDTIYFYYNTAAGSAPIVTLFLQGTSPI